MISCPDSIRVDTYIANLFHIAGIMCFQPPIVPPLSFRMNDTSHSGNQEGIQDPTIHKFVL